MLERDIESKVQAYCKRMGVLCYKWVAPSHKGVPDRLLVFPGGFVVFVELKAPGGRLSPIQRYEHARMERQGAVVETFYGFEPFKAWVDERIRLL